MATVLVRKICWLAVCLLGFLLLYSKLTDIFGQKSLLILAQVIFLVFSMACGAAQTMNQLYESLLHSPSESTVSDLFSSTSYRIVFRALPGKEGRMEAYLMTLRFAWFCALCSFLCKPGLGSLNSRSLSSRFLFSSWIFVLRDWFNAHLMAGMAKNEAAYACTHNSISGLWGPVKIVACWLTIRFFSYSGCWGRGTHISWIVILSSFKITAKVDRDWVYVLLLFY